MVGAEVDVDDFEPEEDDMMDDDTAMDDGNADVVHTLAPKFKLTIMGGTSQLGDGDPDKTKGRGFRKDTDVERNSRFVAQE
jgi:RNA-binding protein 8A